MPTSDPFSADRVPDPDANNSNEPALNQPLPDYPAPAQPYSDPAASPAQPAPSQHGYASPPPYSQPPAYAQPPYGGYQQPPPSPPVDGVSIAAFATSLLMLSPVAVILGGIGLARTAKRVRSGRWMAWTGMALGVLGIIAWVMIIAVLGWMRDTIEQNDSWSGSSNTSDYRAVEPGAATYGDDPYLDGLWDSCEAGDMGACDELFLDSPYGSEYEEFGDNCGIAGRSPFKIFCDD